MAEPYITKRPRGPTAIVAVREVCGVGNYAARAMLDGTRPLPSSEGVTALRRGGFTVEFREVGDG